MAVHKEISYGNIDELCLDPQNPRLGRHNTEKSLSQLDVLNLMRDWTLDELALSYLESGGFWVQEALLVVDEGQNCLIVVEGNRRLAALKYLQMAYDDNENIPHRFKLLASEYVLPPGLFDRVPYLLADSRSDVQAFLGFRHVTGIKEWAPAEKAEFISKLIDEGMTYEQVRRKIGSKTPTVRQNYVAYRLLKQLENQVEDFDPNLRSVQNRFSVMYLSLRTPGVQEYLQLNMEASPQDALNPVPEDRLEKLGNFSRWMFGTDKIPPLLPESRRVDDFGKILQNEESIEYLESEPEPVFELAYQKAGGDIDELANNLRTVANLLQYSLSEVHLHTNNNEIKGAVRLIGKHVSQMLNAFPSIKRELFEENNDA